MFPPSCGHRIFLLRVRPPQILPAPGRRFPLTSRTTAAPAVRCAGDGDRPAAPARRVRIAAMRLSVAAATHLPQRDQLLRIGHLPSPHPLDARAEIGLQENPLPPQFTPPNPLARHNSRLRLGAL